VGFECCGEGQHQGAVATKAKGYGGGSGRRMNHVLGLAMCFLELKLRMKI